MVGSERCHRTLFACFLAVAFALINSCDVLDMNYVPTAEQLRGNRHYKAFIVKETDIEGVYANMDVDSAVFTYISKATNETEFWSEVDKNTQDSGWELVESQDNTQRYERIIPRRGKLAFHSAEEVRIACDAKTMTVVVAWVQADESELPEHFPETGPEGSFARQVIWPKFDELVAR